MSPCLMVGRESKDKRPGPEKARLVPFRTRRTGVFPSETFQRKGVRGLLLLERLDVAFEVLAMPTQRKTARLLLQSSTLLRSPKLRNFQRNHSAQDPPDAAFLAELHSHAEPQYNLGLPYCDGEGVAQDYTMAYVWYNIAAAQERDSNPRPLECHLNVKC